MPQQLGTTVVIFKPPKINAKPLQEQLDEVWQEILWRDGHTDEMPKHLKDQQLLVVLDTQEKLEEYERTGTLKDIEEKL